MGRKLSGRQAFFCPLSKIFQYGINVTVSVRSFPLAAAANNSKFGLMKISEAAERLDEAYREILLRSETSYSLVLRSFFTALSCTLSAALAIILLHRQGFVGPFFWLFAPAVWLSRGLGGRGFAGTLSGWLAVVAALAFSYIVVAPACLLLEIGRAICLCTIVASSDNVRWLIRDLAARFAPHPGKPRTHSFISVLHIDAGAK